jgi:RecG-like helicase
VEAHEDQGVHGDYGPGGRTAAPVREAEDHAGVRLFPGYGVSAEFEEKFPYEETPDQLKAIAEIKADMEKPVPMDRLLCGDVGYGKTEVALRAAFKAVMDGKQVAFLVPTTVLAQQHLLTFHERLDPFGLRVAMVSRFVSDKETKETLRKLEAGDVDILIGHTPAAAGRCRLPRPGPPHYRRGTALRRGPERKDQAVEAGH